VDAKKRQDLKALLRILRTNGVLSFEAEGVKILLSADALELPKDTSGPDITEAPRDRWTDFPDRILTNEELMYYSAGGTPEDAPDEGDDNGGTV
jgi:hypothetical protein